MVVTKMTKQNNSYWFSRDGKIGYGIVSTGEIFMFDADDFPKIKDTTWYRCNRISRAGTYVGNSLGICLHRYILDAPKNFEIDHRNNNPLDNRKHNLRVCTHQQNQCNQPLQQNNSSGVTGVSYYAPRKKYRARIKVSQHDIHLGYYATINEAVQARNIGMSCMFGDFGYYNKVERIPEWICEKVTHICQRFADLSICEAFILSAKKSA
jgi:hypothetical protein